MSYVSYVPIISIALILILFISIIISVFVLRRKKAKKNTIILTILVIVIIVIGTIGFVHWSHNRWLNHRTTSYYVTLVGDEDISSIVEIPMPNSIKLHNLLQITQGYGTFKIEDTQYGKALHVEFSGEIRISAKYETYNPDDYIEKGLSMTITTQNENNESVKTAYLRVVEKGVNLSCNITINHNAALTHQHIEVVADNPALGWNIYPVEESYSVV